MAHQRVSMLVSMLLCLATAACRDAAQPDSDRAPTPRLSAILITLDTTRIDALSVYGGPEGTTPNIDRLAGESVRYDAARAVAPLTMPSHASMLTGLFPPRHSVRNNHVAPLPQSARTLAELARESGLETAAFVSTVALDAALGFDQGFEHYDSPPRRERRGPPSERPSRETISRALAWLKARGPNREGPDRDAPDRDRRFFLWLHLYDPHDPYAAPQEFAERFPRDPYLAEVASMDAELGRLFDFLEMEGLLDDSVVMLIGDHGEGLGEHGEAFHGILLYDATIRVPFIVRDPSGWRAGDRSDEIVSVADVFPTLLEAMGLPRQRGIDGVSLFRRSAPADRGVYFETYQPWILHDYAPSSGWADARGKYLHSAQPEFYETTKDPGEAHNRAAAHRAELADYRDAIDAVAAAPALAQGGDAIDETMLAELAALGYAAATLGDEPFPHPLDVGERPSPARWVKDNAAFQRAKALEADGRRAEAIAVYQALLLGNPNNWAVIYDYAFALMRIGRHEDAIAQLRHYQSGGPPRTGAFMNLAICLLRTDRGELAIEQLERALNLDAQFTPALRQLARLQREAGRLEEAERWEERLRLAEPAAGDGGAKAGAEIVD